MKVVAVLLFAFFNTTSFAQIEIGGEDSKPAPEVDNRQKRKKRDSLQLDGNSAIHLYANFAATNRILKENVGLFGDSLGERANEYGVNNWSFGIAVSNKLNHGFSWEGGLRYLKNGEGYSFEDVDTLHTYTTTYHYVGLPLKVNYSYGNKLKIIAGVGFMPQMFYRYTQDRTWRDAENVETEETFKTSSGFNTVVLSALLSIGINYSYTEKWDVFVHPEYRRQLTSSYTKQDSYLHYGTAFGVNFGLIRKL